MHLEASVDWRRRQSCRKHRLRYTFLRAHEVVFMYAEQAELTTRPSGKRAARSARRAARRASLRACIARAASSRTARLACRLA